MFTSDAQKELKPKALDTEGEIQDSSNAMKSTP